MSNTYGYEIWLGGNWLKSSQSEGLFFFTEAEAMEEAENEVYALMQEFEGYHYFDDFKIVIIK